MKTAAIIIAMLALALVGCGNEDTDATDASTGRSDTPTQTATKTEPAATPEPDPNSDGLAALRSMEDPLLATLITARDRREADEAGDVAKAVRLEARMNRQLKTVMKFGREARKRLIDIRSTPQAKAVTAAADGWTEWAYELRTNPPAGDFDQARHISDLAVDALAATQDAYEAVGTQPPPAFRAS
jgi:hypothetical protein